MVAVPPKSRMSVSGRLLRALILGGCLLASAWYLSRATRFEQIPTRVPLSELPMRFSTWEGDRAEDLDDQVLAVLGVDDYINRVYHVGGGNAVGLYVGYYASQREGESMHSPLNCLPGAGWLPMSSGRLAIPVDRAQPIEVNRYLVQKGGEAMLVLYWYQSHGRVIASEYWAKVFMVLDAVRLNRTDAALVRVVIPINGAASEGQAERLGSDFVRTLFPLLSRHLPV
jgi:EpsI family protein